MSKERPRRRREKAEVEEATVKPEIEGADTAEVPIVLVEPKPELVEATVVAEPEVEVASKVVTFTDDSFSYEIQHIKGESVTLKRTWQVTRSRSISHIVTIRLGPEVCISGSVAFEAGGSVDAEETGRICISEKIEGVSEKIEGILKGRLTQIEEEQYIPSKLKKLEYLIDDIVRVVEESVRRLLKITSLK